MADRERGREVRGVSRADAGAWKKLRTETRPMLQFIFDSFEDSNLVAGVSAFGTLAIALLLPAFVHAWVLLLLPLMAWHVMKRTRRLPLRLPLGANRIDYGEPKPGYKGFSKARGLVLIGYDLEADMRQIWTNRSDETGHLLMLGKTGAGKTEGLMSRIANYNAMGSGCVFVDAKGDRKAAFQFTGLARMCGAEDDVLLLDFVTGGETLGGRRRGRNSNTTNPIATGSADANFQIMSSFLPPAEGENAVFVGRGLALMRALMTAMVDLRDKGHLLLGFGLLSNSLSLDAMRIIYEDERLSERAKNALHSYLKDLPGFDFNKFKQGKPQDTQTNTQHGYGQAYFTNAFGSFAGTYAHVFFANMAEVDFFDVVARRRKLLVMLPPLEKSPAEMKTLGKINLALIKEVFARSLGGAVEGQLDQVVENRPATSATPFPVILDEYAYIATEGIGVIPAQARGLGISVMFAGQDWGGFEAGDKTAAQQIWGSTTVKLFGVVEDPDTIERVVKKFTVEAVAERQEMRMEDGAYRSDSVRWEKRTPVTETDLQRQTEGMAHVTAFGEVFRSELFYADPPMPKEVVINRFLSVGDLEKQWHLHGNNRRRLTLAYAALGRDANETADAGTPAAQEEPAPREAMFVRPQTRAPGGGSEGRRPMRAGEPERPAAVVSAASTVSTRVPEPVVAAPMPMSPPPPLPPDEDGPPFEWSLPQAAMTPAKALPEITLPEALPQIKLPETHGPVESEDDEGDAWDQGDYDPNEEDDGYDPNEDPDLQDADTDDFPTSLGMGDIGSVLGESVLTTPAPLGSCVEEASPYIQGAIVDGLEEIAQEVIAKRPSDAELMTASASIEELFDACLRAYGASRSVGS